VLLNPPRAVLAGRLRARAATGQHFMPPALLYSQLEQLEVADPAELHARFGELPGGAGGGGDAAAAVAFPEPHEIVGALLALRVQQQQPADVAVVL
jgi:hypothetical protein